MKGFGITLVAGAALLATGASLAHAALRPRPADVPATQAVSDIAPNDLQIYDDFSTPARAYSSERAVVHYVVVGLDAPPLNDDDQDGVPDYVERIGFAADAAIAYYGRRGFAPILADEGGPDGRPDLYVSRFAPGYLGVSFPAARAQGGAFVAVSNALDPIPGRSFGSLYGTVAHELFHLTQFSYFRPTDDPPIPGWALEGTAAAMENRVFPELEDTVTSLQLRRWFDAPDQSLTVQTYGSQLLWRYLDEREPRLLPAYLARLAATRSRSAAAALVDTYGRVTGRPFAPAFGRFAGWIAGEYSTRIRPRATIAAGGHSRARIAPLAIHFLRLGRSTRSVTLRFTRGRGQVDLTYELESEFAGRPAVTRRLRPRVVNGDLVYTIPPALRRSPRFGAPTLVVVNGTVSRSVGYAVAAR